MIEMTGRVGSLGAWEDGLCEAQERKREARNAWRASVAEMRKRKAALDVAAATLDGLVDDLATLRVRGT